jgi:uncharacterized protein (UPF0332 family)
VTSGPSEHLEKARRLLRQSLAMSADDAPESVVHLAYYAMFHAATAVLLKHRDSAATTHAGLIGAFGRFVKNRGETARKLGGRSIARRTCACRRITGFRTRTSSTSLKTSARRRKHSSSSARRSSLNEAAVSTVAFAAGGWGGYKREKSKDWTRRPRSD